MLAYTENLYVNSCECDYDNKLKLHSLFNFFQRIAENHAESEGYGISYCNVHNIAWLAGGYHVVIDRFPSLNEKITIETWPAELKTASCFRDFCIKDEKSNIIIRAGSKWALIDREKLRPVSIVKQIYAFEVNPSHILTSDFGKIAFNENAVPDNELSFAIRADDIDYNNHVNNAMYPTWCLDCDKDKYFNGKQLSEIRINFKMPAKYNDRIKIITCKNGNTSVHIIGNEEKTAEYAAVMFKWK